jgi:hypothetical protein
MTPLLSAVRLLEGNSRVCCAQMMTASEASPGSTQHPDIQVWYAGRPSTASRRLTTGEIALLEAAENRRLRLGRILLWMSAVCIVPVPLAAAWIVAGPRDRSDPGVLFALYGLFAIASWGVALVCAIVARDVFRLGVKSERIDFADGSSR